MKRHKCPGLRWLFRILPCVNCDVVDIMERKAAAMAAAKRGKKQERSCAACGFPLGPLATACSRCDANNPDPNHYGEVAWPLEQITPATRKQRVGYYGGGPFGGGLGL